MSKSAMVSEIATKTALSKKQVDSVMAELEDLIERHMRKRAVGEFVLPGLLKIKTAKRPASKKRMGRNPATGEEMVIAAKPASMRVKVTPLKEIEGHDPLDTSQLSKKKPASGRFFLMIIPGL